MPNVTEDSMRTALDIICDLLGRIENNSPYWVPEDYRQLRELLRFTGIRPHNAPTDDFIARRTNV